MDKPHIEMHAFSCLLRSSKPVGIATLDAKPFKPALWENVDPVSKLLSRILKISF